MRRQNRPLVKECKNNLRKDENGDYAEAEEYSDDDRMSATMGRTSSDKLSGLMPSGGGGDMMS
jgi:hypothetical protein